MQLAIVQTSNADVEAFLTMLESLFPPSVVARAELIDQQLGDDAPFPRLIARAFDVTEEELSAGMRVMEKIGAPHFEIIGHSGPLSARAVPPIDEAQPKDIAANLPWASPTLGADPDPEAEAVLGHVLEVKSSGIGFPELDYAKKEKAAYTYIVKQLGKEPYKDQGDTLSEGQINTIERPHRINKQAWADVVEHLETELRYFRYAREWFSDNGHLRVLYRDQTVFDYDFVASLNTDYGLLKSNLKVSVSLDFGMKLATDAIGAVSGPAAWAVGVLWGLTKQMGSLPDGVMTGEIAKLNRQVAEEFGTSIKIVETAHVGICEDWGNLSDFGRMVDADRLKWPKDAGPVRRAHCRGFHFVALRSLLNLKSDLETYQSSGFRTTFGVIMMSENTDKPVKEGWDSKTGRYRMKSEKGACDRSYNYAYLLGRQDCAFVDKIGWSCHKPWDAEKALVQKLFGTEGTDQNPQLGITPKFLKDKKIRENLKFYLNTAS